MNKSNYLQLYPNTDCLTGIYVGTGRITSVKHEMMIFFKKLSVSCRRKSGFLFKGVCKVGLAAEAEPICERGNVHAFTQIADRSIDFQFYKIPVYAQPGMFYESILNICGTCT